MTEKSSSNLKLLVHPLVILQISEHCTRHRVQRTPEMSKVYGIVLGKVSGRMVEAVNSFTAKTYINEDSYMTFNLEHVQNRLAQYHDIFPELQVIGMYCTGEFNELDNEEIHNLTNLGILNSNQEDKSVHIVSPVFLKLITSKKMEKTRKVPLVAFECVCETRVSTPVEWTLVSEESERIGVNDIEKLSTREGSDNGSHTAKQFKTYTAAVSMLIGRIEVILAYFKEVQNGTVELDPEILRESNLLTNRLRLMVRHAEQNKKHFDEESREIAVFSLLPKMTNLLNVIAQVWTKLAHTKDLTPIISTVRAYPGWQNAVGFSRAGGVPGSRNDPEDLEDTLEDEEPVGPKRKLHAPDGAVRYVRNSQEAVAGRATGGAASGSNFSIPNEEGARRASPAYVPDAPMPSASGANDTA